VAYGLSRWVVGFRDGSIGAFIEPNKLLVLAGSSYTQPLVERGAFKYGISRMAGDPDIGHTFPLQDRFLFDEIDAGGIDGQMGWMSEAIGGSRPSSPRKWTLTSRNSVVGPATSGSAQPVTTPPARSISKNTMIRCIVRCVLLRASAIQDLNLGSRPYQERALSLSYPGAFSARLAGGSPPTFGSSHYIILIIE